MLYKAQFIGTSYSTSPTMAMLLGAFIIQGVQPGPLFISQYPDLFRGVIASMYVGSIILLVPERTGLGWRRR